MLDEIKQAIKVVGAISALGGTGGLIISVFNLASSLSAENISGAVISGVALILGAYLAKSL